MEQREVDNMLLSMIQKHFPSLPLSDEHTDWGKWLGFARAVYEAGRASPASVPEGWKLVPVEPTPEMLTAGECESDSDRATYETVYAAMIASAPTPATWPDGTPRAFDNYAHDKQFSEDSPTPPVSEDKDKIIAAANALENIASTSSSTRIRRVANDALTAIRARRK